MKELSIEEKAQAYDEAIERARKLKENPQSVFNEYSPKEGDTICDYIFPELKELGDEKIRKWIIDDIRYNMNNEPLNNSEYKKKTEEAIVWLKKQGNIVDALIQEASEKSYTEGVERKHWLEKQDEPYGQRKECLYCQFNYFGECKGFCQMKRDEQKPADKVEPKFHEGDWIISDTANKDYHICKITGIKDGNYTIESIYGYKGYNQFDVFDNAYRLWNIKDAKDGDIISYDDGWTCIFKNIHGIWYSSYCFITDDGEFHTGYERHAVDAKINGNAHPATKEQRDLLFKKMKEACYEWGMLKRKINNYGKNKSF